MDEHLGLHREISRADVADVSRRSGWLVLLPATDIAIGHQQLVLMPWRPRAQRTRLAIRTADIRGGRQELASGVRDRQRSAQPR